ncbi:putative phosphoribosyl transferase [Streptomyces afghaniensis 772]|uniref:Putative phosphoribosyl transferase n=1 Tax=Streptomyces afghaniensis 772 TaxID=1283301 RepID=S4N3U8_9ACTN|nr:putative phosphoribosyl transferase [Streptomyces afghaniensis 772]
MLAPNRTTGRPWVPGACSSQSTAATSRRPSSGMSKRSSAVRTSSRSSSSVSRSIRRVPSPAVRRPAATSRLRGLCRELPLPWANSTTARAAGGTVRSPVSVAPPAGTVTVWEFIGGLLSPTSLVLPPAYPHRGGRPASPPVWRDPWDACR